MAPAAASRKAEAQRLNRLIEAALLDAGEGALEMLLAAIPHRQEERAADRVTHRATWLARRRRPDAPAIIVRKERIIEALYARRAPAGWWCGWCDGTRRNGEKSVSAVGGVALDEGGVPRVELSQRIASRPPFETEIAAAALLAEAASGLGCRRLRLYSDCPALVEMWLKDLGDERLGPLREQAGRLEAFALYHLPRRHNHRAHRLARQAATP